MDNGSEQRAERMLRMRALCEICGVSRTTIYAWVKLGILPKPVKLGLATIAWRESEVIKAIAARETAS